MNRVERRDMKYLSQHCPFFKKEVWAIVTKQADGTWRIVNCLDKHESCFKHDCAFTVDGGEWPFDNVSVKDPETTERP